MHDHLLGADCRNWHRAGAGTGESSKEMPNSIRLIPASNYSCASMRSCSLLKVQTGRAMSQMIVAFAVLLAAIAPVAARDWPNRPVTMLVPFAAAGGAD